MEVFIFHRGAFVGSRMISTARVVTVGSGPDAQLRLDDPYVAPRHAVLHSQGGRLYISDNQTAQGILVNGQRVQSAEVTAFDEIQIGECRLKFEPVAGAAAPVGPVSPNAELVRPGAPPPPDKARFAGGPMSPSQQVQATSLVPRAQNKRRSHPPTGMNSLDHDLFGDLGHATPPPPPPLSDIVSADQLPSLEGLEPATEVASAEALGLDFPPTNPPLDSRSDGRTQEAVPRVEATSPRAPRHKPRAEPEARDPSEPDFAAQDDLSPGGLGVDSEALSHGPGMPVEGELLPGYDESELSDEELEELDFAQPFSLLENVIRERFQTPVQSEPEPVVEVISYREGRLFDVTRIERGGVFEVLDQNDTKPVPLLQLRRNGRARLLFRTSTKGSVVVGGQTTTLATLCAPENLENKKRELYRAELAEGDFAHIKLDGRGYLLRFVRSPKPPPRKLDASVSAEDRRHVLVALGVMLLVFAGFWLFSLLSPTPLQAAPDDVEFAEVTLKDLELEKPEEPPPPEPEPEPEPPAPTDEPPPPPPPEPEKKPKQKPEKRARQKDVAPPPDPSQEAAKEALAALSTLAPTKDSKLSAKVTNIAAVRVPDGASKRFKVAGEISKLGGSDVILSTSGSGGKTTRSAAKLLEGRNIGAIAQRGSTGPVRGTVSRLPPRDMGQEGGSLSREAILKVVMAGLGDVQRCYERALMSSPGLQGKVVFDWVISPSGRVQSTRVRSSTMSSQAVTTCISGVIKGWQFPQPQGGSVKVTYPFIFKASSF